jgi:hypothetical protein
MEIYVNMNYNINVVEELAVAKGGIILKTAVYCLVLLLSIYPLSGYGRMLTYDEQPFGVVWDGEYQLAREENMHRITKDGVKDDAKDNRKDNTEDITKKILSPMEALEIVKKSYASNFERIEISEDAYYYKLELAEYYLFYEGEVESEQQYLFHLYEFVLDEPKEEIGHTVTYGWYHVDKVTGEIIEVQ